MSIYIECLFPWSNPCQRHVPTPLGSIFNAIKQNIRLGVSSKINLWFSNLVDVDVRTGNHDLDDPLAIGTLAVTSNFKYFTCPREWKTIGTVNTTTG
jgi:hypothetical protein